MSKKRIRLSFEHVACDVVVDIYLPLPDPITEGAETIAARVCPACPACTRQMQYAGFSFATDEENTPPPEPKTSAREHSPRINFDPPRIISCSCGWITPPGTTDSDTAWVEHAATVLQ